mmetsp:Transcript_15471/g.36809  ORF Transcript_15471/g.36809 Transcript_15471/m.36809 type:complete len:295 (+) Transcript_15471:690-1574(+)
MSISSSECGLDDVEERRLEGGAADQESVDVLEADERVAVAVTHTTSVCDAGRLGYLSRHLLLQNLADGRMGLLRLFGRGDHSRADGPHRLVGYHDLRPVSHLGDEGLDLLLDDVGGLAGLALVEHLANAHRRAEARLLTDVHFVSDDLVCLAVVLSSLRVADERPFETEILDMIHSDLSGVCAHAGLGHVLGADLEASLELLLDHVDVERHGSYHHIDLLGVEFGLVECLTEGLYRRLGAVALPVAANPWLARAHDDVITRQTAAQERCSCGCKAGQREAAKREGKGGAVVCPG